MGNGASTFVLGAASFCKVSGMIMHDICKAARDDVFEACSQIEQQDNVERQNMHDVVVILEQKWWQK